MADTPRAPAGQAPVEAVFATPHITRLRLTNFRSHAAFDMTCHAGAVIITGANGLGKTNILEAVSMLAAGRGLRSCPLEDMQKDRVHGWTVLADIDGPMGAVRAGVGFAVGDSKAGRQVRIDGDTARVDDLARLVPQLWLTPAMDRLFVDGAAARRKFLDRFAQSLDVGLSRHLSAFEKAMRERNRLLQTPGTPFDANSWLDGLEEEMALHGVAIAAARLVALDALAVGLAAIPEAAFPRAEVALEGLLEAGLRAQAALDVEDMYRRDLRDARGLDASAGRTLSGPHRADLQVVYAAKNMPAGDCSTGEQKALLVGLILAQAHSVAARTGDVPILLLDEVAAHLDNYRRDALAEILASLGGQSWITGTDASAFGGFSKATAIQMNDDVTGRDAASITGPK